jgi:hypothetical protein
LQDLGLVHIAEVCILVLVSVAAIREQIDSQTNP